MKLLQEHEKQKTASAIVERIWGITRNNSVENSTRELIELMELILGVLDPGMTKSSALNLALAELKAEDKRKAEALLLRLGPLPSLLEIGLYMCGL